MIIKCNKKKFFFNEYCIQKGFKYTKNFFKIQNETCSSLRKKLFQLTKIKFNMNIEYNNFDILSINDTFLKYYIIQIETIDSKDSIFVFLSHIHINTFVELIFGKNIVKFNDNPDHLFVSSKKYIINEIIIGLIQLYNHLFNNIFCFDKKYKIFKKKIDFSTLDVFLNNIFFTINHIFKSEFLELSCMIIFSIEYLKVFEKKFHSVSCVKSNSVVFKTQKILLKHIHNIKLKLLVKLEKNTIFLKKILNLKLYDIVNIKKPNMLIVQTKDSIPILRGKYYSDEYRSMIYVKENFLNISDNHNKTIVSVNETDDTNHSNINLLKSSTVNSEINNICLEDRSFFSFDIEKLKNSILSNVKLDVEMMIGNFEMKIQDLIKIKTGSVIYLDILNHIQVNIVVNNILIAKGEFVYLNDKYGVRIIKIFQNINS
ncbi:FliM/FliN family flagellar motor switch protein [Buchnera aphidicola]|uniref:FliM/FliN family flagellar motor switch protein n=1 Tax=Buchnera aphidicola TaxID=9 RepID=UPI003463F037